MIATMELLNREPTSSDFDGYQELAAEVLKGAAEDWIDPSRSPHSKNDFAPSRLDIFDFVYSKRFTLFVACLDWVKDIEVERKSFRKRLLALLKKGERNRLIREGYDTGMSLEHLALMFGKNREAIRSVIRRSGNG